jgi:hypothetical protein
VLDRPAFTLYRFLIHHLCHALEVAYGAAVLFELLVLFVRRTPLLRAAIIFSPISSYIVTG